MLCNLLPLSRAGFPGGASGKKKKKKKPTCQCRRQEETRVQSLGREDPLEEEMAVHASILAWRIPWTGEPGGLWSIRLQRVRHYRSDSACSSLQNGEGEDAEVCGLQAWFPICLVSFSQRPICISPVSLKSPQFKTDVEMPT